MEIDMREGITETMDRKELMEMLLVFFDEVQLMSESFSNRIQESDYGIVETLRSIENTDLSQEEGYAVYTELRNRLNNRNKLAELARFYTVVAKHIDCGAMYQALREAYEELWPEEKGKNEHLVEDLVKDLLNHRKGSEEEKRSDKEAEPAESVS